MITTAFEFGFLFGKTMMSNQDLDRWLKVDSFADGIRNMVLKNKQIGDVEILFLADQILNENLNSDTICGVNREKLVAGVVSLRNQMESYVFKPSWLKKTFPSVWDTISNKIANEDMIIVPSQMNRFSQILKYIKSMEGDNTVKVSACWVDESNSGHVAISSHGIYLNGTKQVDELFGRFRFCDSIDIDICGNTIKVLVTVPDIMIAKESFDSRQNPKKAWVLKWNQTLKREEFLNGE